MKILAYSEANEQFSEGPPTSQYLEMVFLLLCLFACLILPFVVLQAFFDVDVQVILYFYLKTFDRFWI